MRGHYQMVAACPWGLSAATMGIYYSSTHDVFYVELRQVSPLSECVLFTDGRQNYRTKIMERNLTSDRRHEFIVKNQELWDRLMEIAAPHIIANAL